MTHKTYSHDYDCIEASRYTEGRDYSEDHRYSGTPFAKAKALNAVLDSRDAAAFISTAKNYSTKDISAILRESEGSFSDLVYILTLMEALKDPWNSHKIRMNERSFKHIDIVITMLADSSINHKTPDLLEVEFYSETTDINAKLPCLTSPQITDLCKHIGTISFLNATMPTEIMPFLLKAKANNDNSCKQLKLSGIKVTTCSELNELFTQATAFNDQNRTQYSITYSNRTYLVSTSDVCELRILGLPRVDELLNLLNILGNIVRLIIGDLIWYSSYCAAVNLVEKFPNLRSLTLKDVKLNADADSLEFFTQISQLSQLEALTINSIHTLSPNALAKLAESRCLHSLTCKAKVPNFEPLANAMFSSNYSLKDCSVEPRDRDTAAVQKELQAMNKAIRRNKHLEMLHTNDKAINRIRGDLTHELESAATVNISDQLPKIISLIGAVEDFVELGYPSILAAQAKKQQVMDLVNKIAAHWKNASVDAVQVHVLPQEKSKYPMVNALVTLAKYKQALKIKPNIVTMLETNDQVSLLDFLKEIVALRSISAELCDTEYMSKTEVDTLRQEVTTLIDRFVVLWSATTPDDKWQGSALNILDYFKQFNEKSDFPHKLFFAAFLLIINAISIEQIELVIQAVNLSTNDSSKELKARTLDVLINRAITIATETDHFNMIISWCDKYSIAHEKESIRLAEVRCFEKLFTNNHPGSDESIALTQKFLAYNLSNMLQIEQFSTVRECYQQFLPPHLLSYYKKELEKLGLKQFSNAPTLPSLHIEILAWLSHPLSLISSQRNNLNQIATEIKALKNIGENAVTSKESATSAAASGWFGSWWRSSSTAAAAAAAAVGGDTSAPSTPSSTLR